MATPMIMNGAIKGISMVLCPCDLYYQGLLWTSTTLASLFRVFFPLVWEFTLCWGSVGSPSLLVFCRYWDFLFAVKLLLLGFRFDWNFVSAEFCPLLGFYLGRVSFPWRFYLCEDLPLC